MALTLAVIASLLVALLVSSAAGTSTEFARDASPVVAGTGTSEMATARAQRRADRVVRKFLRGRISARVAAQRVADLLDRERDAETHGKPGKLVVCTGDKRLVVGTEAIYGVLFQVDSVEEQEKIAELAKEVTRIQALRARLRSKP